MQTPEPPSSDPLASAIKDSNIGAKAFFVLVALAVVVPIGWKLSQEHRVPKSTTLSPTSTVPSVSKLKPPIIVQVDRFTYGRGSHAKVGFEGKVYNPNATAITRVRVIFHVYVPVSDRAKEILTANDEADCSFDFAYIPPQTTYDFKTNRIEEWNGESFYIMKMEDEEIKDILGVPEIKFERDLSAAE